LIPGSGSSPGGTPPPDDTDVTPVEAATILREILAGIRPLVPVDQRRIWSMTAFGPVGVDAEGWRCFFHAEDGSLDRLESIRTPDGREGHWTRWFTRGEENPLLLLDEGEQQELEIRLRECR
jgi:hypothetical protein